MTGTPQVQSIRMRAVQAAEPGAPFQPATKIVPDPGPSQVRVRVHACGVCAGDGLARYGAMGVERSEERRVGKECRARRVRDDKKEKESRREKPQIRTALRHGKYSVT